MVTLDQAPPLLVRQIRSRQRLAVYRRLLSLNLRHSVGLWLLPLMLALAWYAGRERYDDGVKLWVFTSAAIGFAAVFVCPVAAGVAAWVGLQTKRRRLSSVLGAQPGQQLPHHATALTALLIWIIVAFAINAAYQARAAHADATWGRLDPAPVVLGLALLVTAVTVGYVLGVYLPFLATPPVIAVAMVGWQFGLVAGFQSSSLRYLSPFTFLSPEEPGVLARYWPAIFVPMIGWLLGLAGLALAALSGRYVRPVWAVALVVSALAVTVLGARALLAQPASFSAIARERVAYEPVCAHSSGIAVCVHPAYQAILPETAKVAGLVFAPVAGLPGIPERIEQYPPYPGAPVAPGVASYLPVFHAANGEQGLAVEYALAIVETRQPSGTYPGLSPVQCVIGRWLLDQAGYDAGEQGWIFMPRTGFDSRATFDALDARLNEAVASFGALPPEIQRQWLATYLADLQVGKLTLDDLP